MNGLLNT